MFLTCCRKSVKEEKHDKQSIQLSQINGSKHQEVVRSKSNGSIIESPNNSPNLNNKESPDNNNSRTRTISISSLKSIESFHSVRSTAVSDGDFYSVYSNDSFKST